MLPIETELCAYTVESCRAAARAGMTRVELCASPCEGGTTPSAAAVRMARSIPGLELAVMIRPRGGDFLYTAQEFGQMRLDIEYARSCGADAVVLGLLLPDGRIDTERTAELVAAAGAMEVTFHRAADLTPDPVEAVGDILAAGCRRILTSGGCQTAAEGLPIIREMVRRADGRIEIMAGSGVSPDNARLLAEAGVDAIHFSARRYRPSGMVYRRDGVPMGLPGVPDYDVAEADEETIRAILNQLTR